MTHLKKLINICFAVTFLVTISFCNERSTISFSMSSSYFSDNNIYEDINLVKISDQFLQLWLNTKINFKKNNHILNFTLIGNTQHYFNYSNEDKLFSRINFDYVNYLNRKNIISINGFYTRKNWFQIDKFYDTSILNLAYTKKQGRISFRTNIIIGNSIFSYFSEFDNINYGIRPTLFFQKNNILSFNLFFETRFFDYQNRFINKKRFDKSNLVNIGFEYKNGLIFGSNFQYVLTNSNYDFLVNNSFSIMPYLSAEFKDFYYQIIVKWNLKKYKNKINTNQVNLIFPDPEANTNNQIYFGFDREVSKKLSLTGKAIFFASEYKYQADFYEKFMVGIGLKYGL